MAYDGTYITQTVEPSVTSIVQPTKELAKEAARLICELVNGKTYKNEKVTLGVSVRKGRTTMIFLTNMERVPQKKKICRIIFLRNMERVP